MLKLPWRARGKRLLIFESPAAQAPPPPVRVNPPGHVTVAQVLGTPPASVQFVEPELTTSIQSRQGAPVVQVVAQNGGVPPAALLSVNTIAGSGVVGTTVGVPTKLRLFDSPVKLWSSQPGA